MTADLATTLRLVPDRALWLSPAERVVAGGAPWRLSRLAPQAFAVLSRARERGVLELHGDREQAIGRMLIERGWAHPVVASRSGPHPVTVVVPAFGRGDALRRCLQSLVGLDVLVVDDGTPDPREVSSAAADWGAQLLRLSENSGPAAARNAGLRAATTELVAFVDSDCSPDPGWLDALVPHFDDSRVAMVAPRILPRTDTSGLLPRFEQASSALDMGRYPALVRPGARLGFLPSAAILVRRDALVDSGFDEELRLGEDVDLVWRTADRGYLVRFEPSVVVRHDPPAAWGSWARRRLEYGTSAVALEARHPGRLAPVRVSPWNLAVTAAWATRQPLLATGTLGVASGLLARRLSMVDIHGTVAAQLVARGVAADFAAMGHALRREYWPLGFLAAVAAPRSRLARLATAAMAAPLLLEWARERPHIDPVRYVGLRFVADAAYGSGVLISAVRSRDGRALVPRLRRRERHSAQM